MSPKGRRDARKRRRSTAVRRAACNRVIGDSIALIELKQKVLTMALSVSPTTVKFPPTPVGPDCPGENCTYAEVTITNTGPGTEHLVGATAGPGPFWPTFGGTCNVQYLYFLPAGQSCTFQWGFKPEKPGQRRDSGQVNFESGASMSVELEGRGKPH